ncbi:hypothetical protein PSTT_16175 [Puccinia striiformis]|uniref:UBC core domain-containing protein n=1 Tax=Puccinia striiformis TaxID=27350 RepID=A0A2S4UEF9_9BASI|nr:hypothetical protein PSTT_16175 [Puccinia striiformis]
MARISTKRLTKELMDLQDGGCPVGCTLMQADDLVEWKIKITGPPETLYSDENFVLRFRFSPQYPIEAPEVVFVVTTHHDRPQEQQAEETAWAHLRFHTFYGMESGIELCCSLLDYTIHVGLLQKKRTAGRQRPLCAERPHITQGELAVPLQTLCVVD